MKPSIIIPFYGAWSLTHHRLMELEKNLSDAVEIVLVDDFSRDDRIDTAVAWWQEKSRHSVIYVKNGANMGFGFSMNRGVENSSGDVVILLSNDVQVSGDFVTPILEKLTEDGTLFLGGELHDWNTGWNVLKINKEMRLFPYAAGWLIACTKEAWNDIGGFDPLYGKFDYEDMDISTMAIHKGYKLQGLEDLRYMLRHFSGQTVRKHYPDRERYTNENREKFIKKWSEILK